MSIISALIPAVVAFFQPFLGVLVLLITLWLSPLFPGSGAFTFNRFVGIATFAGIVSKKAILKSDTKSFVIGKFDYYFWAYLVTILVSVFVNGRAATFHPDGAFRGLVMGYLLYFLMVNITDSWQKLKTTAWVLIIISLIIAGGLIGELSGISFIETGRQLDSYGRSGGYFQYIDQAAQFSFVGIILTLWLVRDISRRNIVLRNMMYMLIILLSIGLLITGNRAMLLALIVGSLMLFLLQEGIKKKLQGVLVILVAITVSAYIIYPYLPQTVRRATSVLPFLSTVAELEDWEREVYARGYGTRWAMIQAAWNMFRERPIFGMGFETYKSLVFFYQIGDVLHPRQASHNVLMTVLGETGLISAILLIMMYREVIVALWRFREIYVAKIAFILLFGSIIRGMLGASYVERPLFFALAFCMIVVNLGATHGNLLNSECPQSGN